jgi:TonB family protein
LNTSPGSSSAGWVIAAVVTAITHASFALGAVLLPPLTELVKNRASTIVERKLPKKKRIKTKPLKKPEAKKPEAKKPEAKKPEAKKPEAKKRPKRRRPKKVAMRKQPKPEPKPVGEPPPKGMENAKTPPGPKTGLKFGLEMGNSVTAPPGKGVAVPQGGSLRGDPNVKRMGKGKPTGRGFKKTYQPGERAPVAVITTKPKPLKRVVPNYSERMRELEIEGRVRLLLTVNGKGRVSKVKVLKGLRKELDDEAVKAAKKMLFAPAKVNGVPVTVTIPYTFTFVLD